MKNKKTETFVYNGLGFSITLVNAPMKKIFGEWIIDIDMTELQLVVLRALINKPIPLTKDELRFIRKFLSMTTTNFGKLLGVTHVAVLHWENGQRKMTPAIELFIRLHVLNHLHAKDREFRNLYNKISLEKLSKNSPDDHAPIEINASGNLKIA